MALHDMTRDENDLSVIGKGKGRATTTAEQCPVCLQDVEGDLDVVAAHIDACLTHAELQRPHLENPLFKIFKIFGKVLKNFWKGPKTFPKFWKHKAY